MDFIRAILSTVPVSVRKNAVLTVNGDNFLRQILEFVSKLWYTVSRERERCLMSYSENSSKPLAGFLDNETITEFAEMMEVFFQFSLHSGSSTDECARVARDLLVDHGYRSPRWSLCRLIGKLGKAHWMESVARHRQAQLGADLEAGAEKMGMMLEAFGGE